MSDDNVFVLPKGKLISYVAHKQAEACTTGFLLGIALTLLTLFAWGVL